MRYFVKSLLVLAVATLCSTAMQAQVIAVQTQVSGAEGKAAARTIAVNFQNTPLRTAVEVIKERAGIELLYSSAMVPADRKVTYRAAKVTAQEALAEVLSGTSLRIDRLSDGRLRLMPSQGVKQAQGIIAGRITDAKTGKGIPDATVSVGNSGHEVSSGNDGSYRVAGIPTGTRTLSVRLIGYAKQTRTVVVGEGVTLTVDFKLEPSANVLEQVIVTGTVVQTELKAVPNAITVVTAKQIEDRGITRIDQLFRGDIPGLFSLNSGSGPAPSSNTGPLLDEVTMFSRGATTFRDPNVSLTNSVPSAGTNRGTNPIKTYVDGVEMADSKYLSQIDPKSIERIEILTGPQASTIYGSNAINGVMQIFTKRGSSPRPQLTLNLVSGWVENNFSTARTPQHDYSAQVSGVEGRLSYNAGTSWNYAGPWTPAKQTQRLGYNGGARMDLGKLTADVSGRHGSTRNKQNGNQEQGNIGLVATGLYSPINFADVVPRPQDQNLIGQTFGFSLTYRPSLWWSNELGIGSDASKVDVIWKSPALLRPRDTTLSISSSTRLRNSERYAAIMQVPISALAKFDITIGADHWRTSESSWRATPPNSLTGTFSTESSPGITRNIPEKNTGAFMQGQFGLFDALFLTYGVRADWNPTFGDDAKVKPGRYGVSYSRDINTPIGSLSTKFRAIYGRSIRPPSQGVTAAIPLEADYVSQFGQVDRRLPNPNLAPEHQQGGEGGIELYLGSRASLVVTRFNQTVDNLIMLVGGFRENQGPGLDSVRGLIPGNPFSECSSSFRDAGGYCYLYQTQYGNVGSIRNQGWELQSSINMGPLATRGTYSWVKSRILGITPLYSGILTATAFQPGRSFSYVPEHTWSLSTTYAHSTTSVSLFVNGVGMRYLNRDELSLITSNSVTRFSPYLVRIGLPASYLFVGAGYTTADLNATHRLSSRIDAMLQVNNLTDYYQNDVSAVYATMGRQSRIGIRMRW